MFDVLDANFAKMDTLEMVSSANYSIYWQEVGGITLIAAATAHNLELLQNDRYIAVVDQAGKRRKNETVYLICNVAINEEKAEITVNGKSCDYLLHGRALFPTVLQDTSARAAAAKMVSDNLRGIPLSVGTSGELDDTDVVRYPMDGGALDERILEFYKYCGIGKRVWLEHGQLVYKSDSGRDLTGLENVPVFGSGSGTARAPTIAIDSSDHCNVATATLTYNNDKQETVSYGSTDASGTVRRELYCGEIMQQAEETDAEFRARAKAEAEGMLAEHIRRYSVSADMAAHDLDGIYQLGDIVPVRVGGHQLEKRITGMVWLKDSSNDRVSIKLGDPIMTVIAEIKEKKPTSSSVSKQIGGLRARASATEEKTKLIQEDYESLIAKVDGVVAGMDAYVLNKVFEEYKSAVARSFATIEDVNAELALYATKAGLENTEKSVANLTTRVTGAEASISLNSQNINGISSSMATIQADVINLKGRVDLTGSLSVSDGVVNVSSNLFVGGSITSYENYIGVGGNYYEPKPITSTSGTVRVLGLA